MSRVIFDIETAGYDFDSLEPEVRDYLTKWADSEEDRQAVKESLSFYPNTAEVVAIGMLNPDTSRGAVYYSCGSGRPEEAASGGKEPIKEIEEEGIRYTPCTEKEILQHFWDVIVKYDSFVTFNGRAFDCPFILIRTAVHRLKPSRELMPNRYGSEHIDLMDRLMFFGATRKRFSMDMWCRTFGIKSPKSDGVTGYDVKDLFRAGEYEKIARYCAGDLFATKELLHIWERHVCYPPKGGL